MPVLLRRISAAAGQALRAGRIPDDVRVAPDYPTEFSAGVGGQVESGSGPLGPFFIHRSEDDLVVGEIGGAVITPGIVEIGYAVVRSGWGRGYATAAVRALVERARAVTGLDRIIAHAPLDRPASGRVLEKAGFTFTGEQTDEHEGTPIRVKRWELVVAGDACRAGIEVRGTELTTAVAGTLLAALNAELSALYPEEGANHFRLDPGEVAPGQGAFLVAYAGDEAIGCGALRRLDGATAEIKRMFVTADRRGRGIGRALLAALEAEGRRLGVTRLVLETGDRQPEAIALYNAFGFTRIPSFGDYARSPLSVCMGKAL
jgi:putative acetyltransferase